MFVALEGIDGSGKTTLAKSLAEKGYHVTMEPFSDVTKEVLSLIQEPLARELVFYLDRLYHLEKVIKPQRDAGMTTVTDRYKHSQIAYAYARYGEGEIYRRVLELNSGLLDPDIVLFLDVSPHTALERKPGIARDAEPYGNPEEFFRKVRDKYVSMADERWTFIDAEKPRETILREVLDCLSKR
jgi:dTMP kinase